jgi:hypothetical protein
MADIATTTLFMAAPGTPSGATPIASALGAAAHEYSNVRVGHLRALRQHAVALHPERWCERRICVLALFPPHHVSRARSAYPLTTTARAGAAVISAAAPPPTLHGPCSTHPLATVVVASPSSGISAVTPQHALHGLATPAVADPVAMIPLRPDALAASSSLEIACAAAGLVAAHRACHP